MANSTTTTTSTTSTPPREEGSTLRRQVRADAGVDAGTGRPGATDPQAQGPADGGGGEQDDRLRRRRWARWARRTLGILVAVLAVVGVFYAYMPKPVPVDVARVTRSPLVVAVEEDGKSRVADRFVVSAPVTGTLGRLELDPGDRVAQGDVLARIVPLPSPLLDARARAEAQARVAQAQAAARQSRASIARAEAAYEMARSEAARQNRLARGGASSDRARELAELEERSAKEELASARFGARVAGHEVRMAQAALGAGRGDDTDTLEVISPVDGVILAVHQESEGVVQAGAPILEVGDADHLEIVVDVLTTDAVDIEPGAAVRIHNWGGDGALQAHVRRVEPSAFTRVSALGVEEQRVNVVIDLDEPRERWAALGDGYRVDAEILIWRGDDVRQVPASAVFRHEGGWATYAVDADDRVALRGVEVGRRNGEAAQILGGIDEGDRVVLHPSDRVEQGVRVEER